MIICPSGIDSIDYKGASSRDAGVALLLVDKQQTVSQQTRPFWNEDKLKQ